MAKSGKKVSKKLREKIRLSKAQKIHVAQLIRIENRITVCREYIQHWSKFFKFFADDIQNKKINPQEEKAFFQTITTLARQQFIFTELMGDAFGEGADIIKILQVSVSLANIKNMGEDVYSSLELDWHSVFLSMHVTLGRLLRQVPPAKRAEMMGEIEGPAKKQAKSATKKKGMFGRKKKA